MTQVGPIQPDEGLGRGGRGSWRGGNAVSRRDGNPARGPQRASPGVRAVLQSSLHLGLRLCGPLRPTYAPWGPSFSGGPRRDPEPHVYIVCVMLRAFT